MVLFNGEKKDWEVFKMRFETLAAKKGYEDILTGIETVPKMQYDTATGKKIPFTDATEKDLYKLSITAYSDLLLAMNTKTTGGKEAFGIIKSFKEAGSDYPQGDVQGAWEALDKAYSRSGSANQFELSEQWDGLQMQKAEKEHARDARVGLPAQGNEVSRAGDHVRF